ncbi:hypothetical protein KIN20_010582 [Parelaphostrongylus tenuis]|uniref:Uncharacterized protein n=1 Tax=Parelaphostrongylus tenuis TaxID=148309 RepID=A0AAD5M822_PARTN|nr:hypothetical protein KIN20_010582 [Parelaphostrongylus tenuis]
MDQSLIDGSIPRSRRTELIISPDSVTRVRLVRITALTSYIDTSKRSRYCSYGAEYFDMAATSGYRASYDLCRTVIIQYHRMVFVPK